MTCIYEFLGAQNARVAQAQGVFVGEMLNVENKYSEKSLMSFVV